MSGPTGNPLKSDPFLKKLLEESLRIESQQDFDEWKTQFAERLESILEPDGIVKAQEAYSNIGKDMDSLATTAFLLQNQISLGRLSSHQVSVKGRKSLNEAKLAAIEATEKIEAWLPSSLVDEGKLGYNKYQLGVVLVKDGFEAYMTMALCRDMLKWALETTVGITDRQAWQAVKYFERQIQRFCDVMADLGLYELMDKSFQTRSTSYKREMRRKVGVVEVQQIQIEASGDDAVHEVEDKDDDSEESEESADEIVIMVSPSRRRRSLFGNMLPKPLVLAEEDDGLDVTATPSSCGSGAALHPRRRRSLNGNMQPEEAPDYGEYNDQRMPAEAFLSLAESYSAFHFSMSSFHYDPENSTSTCSFQLEPDEVFFSDDDDDESSGNNGLQDVPEESEMQDVPEGAEVDQNKTTKTNKKARTKEQQDSFGTGSQLGGVPTSKLKKSTKKGQQLALNRPTNKLKGPQRRQFASGINRPTNKLIGQKPKTQPELCEPKGKIQGNVKKSVLRSLPFRPWHRSQHKGLRQQSFQQVKRTTRKAKVEASCNTHKSEDADQATPSEESLPLLGANVEEAPPLDESSSSSSRQWEESKSSKTQQTQDEEQSQQQQAPATRARQRNSISKKLFGGLIKHNPQSQAEDVSASGHQLDERPTQYSAEQPQEAPKQDEEQPSVSPTKKCTNAVHAGGEASTTEQIQETGQDNLKGLSMLPTNCNGAESSSSSQSACSSKKLHKCNSLATMNPTANTDSKASGKQIKRQKSVGAKLTQTVEKSPKESQQKIKKPKADAQPQAGVSSNIEATAATNKTQRRDSLPTVKPPEESVHSNASLITPKKIQRRDSALATTPVPPPKEDVVDSNGPLQVLKKQTKRQMSLPAQPMRSPPKEPEPSKEFQGKGKKSKAEEQPLAKGPNVPSSSPSKQIKRQKSFGAKPTQPVQAEKAPKTVAEEVSPQQEQSLDSSARLTATAPVPPPKEDVVESNGALKVLKKLVRRQKSLPVELKPPPTKELDAPKEQPLVDGSTKVSLKMQTKRQQPLGSKPTQPAQTEKSLTVELMQPPTKPPEPAKEQPLAVGLTKVSPKKPIKRQKSLRANLTQPSQKDKHPKSIAEDQSPLAVDGSNVPLSTAKNIQRRNSLPTEHPTPKEQASDSSGTTLEATPTRNIQRRNSDLALPSPKEGAADSNGSLKVLKRRITRQESSGALSLPPMPTRAVEPKNRAPAAAHKTPQNGNVMEAPAASACPSPVKPENPAKEQSTASKTPPKSKKTGATAAKAAAATTKTPPCKNNKGSSSGGGGGGGGGGFRLGPVRCGLGGGGEDDDDDAAELDMDGDGDGNNRWDLRFRLASATRKEYNRKIRHDDCILVPNMFGPSDDFSIYHQLMREIRLLQRQGVAGTKWTMCCNDSVGKHYICPNPMKCPSFKEICTKVCSYFHIKRETLQFTLNWYKPGDQNYQKPRHDEEAYENETGQAPVRNITVAISFGAEHELSLEKKDSTTTTSRRRRHGDDKEDTDDQDKRSNSNSSDGAAAAVLLPLAARISVPQGNNCVFTIGRDVNIRFQHGIVEAAAATKQQQQQQQECNGRIGIILWGRIKDEQVKEDPGSPALLKRGKSPADAAAADTTPADEAAAAAGMETPTGDTAVVTVVEVE